MKTIKLLIITFFFCNSLLAQVIVHSETDNNSSILEINSTTKGLLLPRLTEEQMEAISNPAEGLMVYCTDCILKTIYCFNGSSFVTRDNAKIEQPTEFTVTNFLVDNKVYKRDKIVNKAAFQVTGFIRYINARTDLTLEVYRNNVLHSTMKPTTIVKRLNKEYDDFTFDIEIEAELASYDYVLKTQAGDILRQAKNVVAGDIYFVTGQSNSVWHRTFRSPMPFNNPYIRTFSNTFTDDLNSETASGIGGIAYWFAENIVTQQNIPILVFSNGVGGRPISFFQRDETNEMNGNYGKGLTRLRSAGYKATDFTSVIWYQGESDGNLSVVSYDTAFNSLYNAWEEDFNPDSYYVFQVHQGCGILIDRDPKIPEAHRQLQDKYTKLTTIATNGAELGSDNCHYTGTNGYEVLGGRLYDLLAFKYYDSEIDSGIYSPNPDIIKFGNAEKSTITIALDLPTDTYTIGGPIEDDFIIENSAVSVVGTSISGHIVTLTLSGAVTENNVSLTYLGNKVGVTQYVLNQNNIGMFSFNSIVINPF